MGSSSAGPGGGSGRGGSLTGVLLGIADSRPPGPPMFLSGDRDGSRLWLVPPCDASLPSTSCSRWPSAGSDTSLPASLASCDASCSGGAAAAPLLLARAAAAAAVVALRLSRTSGLCLARLALVGEAKDGRPSPLDKAPGAGSVGVMLVWWSPFWLLFTGTDLLGDVFRRLGADVSIVS
ncbi:hypothetical protein MAPG_06307 [Magnaporthiopsis poae ATCC 64411]|uniref:Uncharacterized protein n=1 Tax=Magnaporthiopsis poae (strain ATCC 64411 / 73-15) TaxID=644358 RepID=A0A0C4E1P1_MAGP6|nr:hypothetical protein MAPG_06307 [Magnaporthiopsis poae ATCC 64411]